MNKVRLEEKVEKRLQENMIKSVKLLKRNVTYKFIQIVNSKTFFNVNNMIYLRSLTSFIKFYIDRVIPKPCRMNFSTFFNCLH